MKYVIMCGGNYDAFKTPKQLLKINGEELIARTIRLLKENNVKDIYITSNNNMFDKFDVARLEHQNTFEIKNGKDYGYWLDAYYPFNDDDEICYLYGDVYYSENAIKTIINYEAKENTLFGTSDAKNEYNENWGEPFAFKVIDNKTFKNGIKEVKKLQDEGKVNRTPITWELYRYLNNFDINIQKVIDRNYICIDDETMDIDSEEEIKSLLDRINKKGS